VKTSLAPGSRVVMDYYDRAGLTSYLDKLGFSLVGYGCTTCIGNSGPLIPAVSAAIAEGDLAVCSVLSGNHNFEDRIHPETKLNYLASPPLVVAYALADTMDTDLTSDPLGTDGDGQPVWLRDIWPSQAEIGEVIAGCLRPDMYTREYAHVFAGDERWRSLPVPAGDTFAWDPASTYVRQPPFFDGLAPEPGPQAGIDGARVLALLGDSITTDHISPAGGHQGRLARGPVPDRAWRPAAGLQLLRVPARQPRGDDPRHLRQHPAAQPARSRHRGRLHPVGCHNARTLLLGRVFPRSSGGSVVLVDQPADRGPAVDPGSHVDGLAWVVYRRVKGSASVGTMMVVVALELGQDGAQVPFTVDQQMVEALSGAAFPHTALQRNSPEATGLAF
jgi:hypothetical protein